MKTKQILIILACFAVILSSYFYYNSIKKQEEMVNNSLDLNQEVINIEPIRNKEEKYLWPKSQYYNAINDSRGDITEPDIYYEEEIIDNKKYTTLTGWVRVNSLKIIDNALHFNLYKNLSEDIKFNGSDSQPVPINLIKVWDKGEERELKDLALFNEKEIINIKIYYKQNQDISAILKLLYGQEVLAKIQENEFKEYDNTQGSIKIDDPKHISNNLPILQQEIYKIVLKEPYLEERVITYGAESTFNEINYYYIWEKDENYYTAVKFNDSEWIKDIDPENNVQYWLLSDAFLDHSKNLYHLDFYCSEFNKSCIAIIKANTIEFDFNIPKDDGAILFNIKYEDENPNKYLWESDKTIIINDYNYNTFPVNISNFVDNNPKLKKQDNNEYTSPGILSFEGEINCGQIKSFESPNKCSLKVFDLSFK